MTLNVPWITQRIEFDSEGFSGEIRFTLNAEYSWTVRDHRFPNENVTTRVNCGKSRDLTEAKIAAEHWITRRLIDKPWGAGMAVGYP
jgi:hypothetical protein